MVELTVVVNVVDEPKVRTTTTVVEKLKEVRADLVSVLLVVSVVLRKLVEISYPSMIVLVLVK